VSHVNFGTDNYNEMKSNSERAELALKLKEAQDKLDTAKKIEADAKAAAAKAQEEAPKDVDESVKTLATEDDNTLYYIGGAVAGVIGLMIITSILPLH